MSDTKSKIFRLSKADNKPLLDFNGDTGKFLISGVSNPENASEFYAPILAWMDDYTPTNGQKVTLEIKMDYFGTSSTKWILQIMKRFEAMASKGVDVSIKWYYYDDDEDLMEAGQQFSELVKIPFELVAFSD